MDEFARRPADERRAFFAETAARRDLTPLIVEKDFWVCWTLRRLMGVPELAGVLTFKGGTSLSKAFGIIKRFSEDIDLTINRAAPLLGEVASPMASEISGKERERRGKALSAAAQEWVAAILLPTLEQAIERPWAPAKAGASNPIPMTGIGRPSCSTTLLRQAMVSTTATIMAGAPATCSRGSNSNSGRGAIPNHSSGGTFYPMSPRTFRARFLTRQQRYRRWRSSGHTGRRRRSCMRCTTAANCGQVFRGTTTTCSCSMLPGSRSGH
jgi:hypothetical protein